MRGTDFPWDIFQQPLAFEHTTWLLCTLPPYHFPFTLSLIISSTLCSPSGKGFWQCHLIRQSIYILRPQDLHLPARFLISWTPFICVQSLSLRTPYVLPYRLSQSLYEFSRRCMWWSNSVLKIVIHVFLFFLVYRTLSRFRCVDPGTSKTPMQFPLGRRSELSSWYLFPGSFLIL